VLDSSVRNEPKKVPYPYLTIGVQHLSGCPELWVRAAVAYVERIPPIWRFHHAILRHFVRAGGGDVRLAIKQAYSC
jgi:hypothetical protein